MSKLFEDHTSLRPKATEFSGSATLQSWDISLGLYSFPLGCVLLLIILCHFMYNYPVGKGALIVCGCEDNAPSQQRPSRNRVIILVCLDQCWLMSVPACLANKLCGHPPIKAILGGHD